MQLLWLQCFWVLPQEQSLLRQQTVNLVPYSNFQKLTSSLELLSAPPLHDPFNGGEVKPPPAHLIPKGLTVHHRRVTLQLNHYQRLLPMQSAPAVLLNVVPRSNFQILHPHTNISTEEKSNLLQLIDSQRG